ncbi:MAG: hypothetical protein ACTHOM_00520 [Allomuricauda sp.]
MMKKLMKPFRIILIGLSILGCDPSESLEAVMSNKSGSDLNIHFVSDILHTGELDNARSVKLLSNKEAYFEGVDRGNVGLGNAVLSFTAYDSIYITNMSEEILKIYKENTPGKNIYNIDEYWKVTESSKNHFVYTYIITQEDIE